MDEPRTHTLKVALVLAVGVAAVSTAAILVRLALRAAGPEASPVALAFALAGVRLALAAALVAPAWRGLRGPGPRPGALRLAAWAGLALGVHFATFITSIGYTSIAASVTLVTSSPVWVALAVWLVWGERPHAATVAGIAIALAGGAVIAFADAGGGSAGRAPLLGDALALAGAVSFSGYLLLAHEAQRRGLALRHVIAITYGVAAVVVLPLPWAVGSGYGSWPAPFWVCAVGLALGPQLVGHSSLQWAVRRVGPTVVALAVLTEPALSTLGGLLVFGERPGPLVAAGAVVLLAGVALAVRHAGGPQAGRRMTVDELPG